MDYICGLDEVGRGPIAGPVTAAAVILPEDFPVDRLRDSKRLSAKRRAELDLLIRERAVSYGIGWASPRTIDSINILQASLLAMRRAYENMLLHAPEITPVMALVDGNQFPNLPIETIAVIKGDSAVPEIMAASIIAKEARDAWMVKAAKRYDRWELDKHKGYPTKRHKQLCAEHGISPIHRRSFRIFA